MSGRFFFFCFCKHFFFRLVFFRAQGKIIFTRNLNTHLSPFFSSKARETSSWCRFFVRGPRLKHKRFNIFNYNRDDRGKFWVVKIYDRDVFITRVAVVQRHPVVFGHQCAVHLRNIIIVLNFTNNKKNVISKKVYISTDLYE